jgi:CheY-like chemotaxis protein
MSVDSSAPIRILSVDDHPVLRQGIAVLLGGQADMKLVAEASNGRVAIQQFGAHRSGRHSDGLADAGNERTRCDYRDSRGIS